MVATGIMRMFNILCTSLTPSAKFTHRTGFAGREQTMNIVHRAASRYIQGDNQNPICNTHGLGSAWFLFYLEYLHPSTKSWISEHIVNRNDEVLRTWLFLQKYIRLFFSWHCQGKRQFQHFHIPEVSQKLVKYLNNLHSLSNHCHLYLYSQTFTVFQYFLLNKKNVYLRAPLI